MSKKIFALATLLILMEFSGYGQKKSGDRPNIIIVLADDMGYSDLGVTGGEISTPNLDSLAHHGMLFTHFYNASVCCPSRTSLLTGLYHHEAGVGDMNFDLGVPSYQGYLNDRCVTIAEALKQNGYSTLMTGKWHIGDKPQYWPQRRGFDQFYGIPAGGGVYFYPSKFLDRPLFLNDTLMHPDKSFYSTDAFTDHAIEFISDAKKTKKPFFLYLAYISPHFPLQAKAEDIAKYRGKYLEGYDSIRMRRFARQKKLGIVSPETKLSPSTYTPWSQVGNKKQESFKMSVYAAQVDCLDQNVGKLMSALREMNIENNTIVFFLSDNGGCATEVNRAPDAKIGTENSFTSYGKNWANVSNTPYRLYKIYEHEGGTITPMIVYWPNGLKGKGRMYNSIGNIIDIMPTCLDLADVKYPSDYQGKKRLPLEGVSLVPAIEGKKIVRKEPFFWEFEGDRAVRKENWKLVAKQDSPWELYDLSKDPTELNNLVNKDTAIYRNLLNLYDKWAAKDGVYPWPLKPQ